MKKFYITATGNDFNQLAKASGGNAQTINFNGEEIYYLNEEIFDDIQGGTKSLVLFKDNAFNSFDNSILVKDIVTYPKLATGGSAAWYFVNRVDDLYDKSVQISIGSNIVGLAVGDPVMAGSGASGIEASGKVIALSGTAPQLLTIVYNSDGNFYGAGVDAGYGAGGTSTQMIGSGVTWVSPGSQGITNGTTTAPQYSQMADYAGCLSYYDPTDYNNHWKFLRPFTGMKIRINDNQYEYNTSGLSDKRWKRYGDDKHPYLYGIAEGKYPGHEYYQKFGRNADVGASQETVWDHQTAYTYETNPYNMTRISCANGSALQEIIVEGLDENWNFQTGTASLYGTLPVTLGSSVHFIRIFRAYNNGSVNLQGDVYVSQGSGAYAAGVPAQSVQIRARIGSTHNQTLMAIYSVPAGKTAHITGWHGSTSASKVTQIELQVRKFGKVFRTLRTVDILDGVFDDIFEFPLIVTEKSDIQIVATSTAGGGILSANFSLWLEDDEITL